MASKTLMARWPGYGGSRRCSQNFRLSTRIDSSSEIHVGVHRVLREYSVFKGVNSSAEPFRSQFSTLGVFRMRQFRGLCSSSDGNKDESSLKEETEEQKAARQKNLAARLARIKVIDETDRYNREKAEYEVKMKAVRSSWSKKFNEKREVVKREQLAREEKRKQLEKIRENERKEFIDSVLNQRTKLEYRLVDLMKENPEDREKRLETQREEKRERRKYTMEKLKRVAMFKEVQRSQYLEYLSREAPEWITASDAEDDDWFMKKINAKLMDIQPINATYQNAVPKRLPQDAEKWASYEDNLGELKYEWYMEARADKTSNAKKQ